jgi:anti-sigma-K factor RskA
MTNPDDTKEQDDDLRLGEYVLGVLDAPQRNAVEALTTTDKHSADRLSVWQEYLVPLAEGIPAVPPPPYIWPRIAAALPQAESPRASALPRAHRRSLWESLTLWRWLAAGSLTTAMVVAGVLVLYLHSGGLSFAPTLTAALQLESGQAAFTATIDSQRHRIVVIPATPIALDGRVAELWLIAPDGTPQSLGILASERATNLTVPEHLRAYAQAKTVFAISLEPSGGSSTGLPTGPVIATGELSSI